MKRTQQRIQDQTIHKTMAKPIGVVNNHEKDMICNKVLSGPTVVTLAQF